MASAEDIAYVKANVGATNLTDAEISALIDAYGPDGAIASIWESKAASYSDLVDTSEAGASLKLSGLSAQALKMATYWRSVADGSGGATGVIRIRQIVRDDI